LRRRYDCGNLLMDKQIATFYLKQSKIRNDAIFKLQIINNMCLFLNRTQATNAF